MVNDHNPRTPRQLPPEMRIGAPRRHQTFHYPSAMFWLALLAMMAMVAGWIATFGLRIP